ncbi:hypothetical protein [Haloglomus salinum]|uniref:hypothetical protein n=1 Tax=Haloglomus salinum TaxID=2962673 RepID=UPI0020C9BFA4|nr:hypothetical protein [Haloglomus salinum]
MGGWYEVTIGRLLAKPRGFARGGRAQSQVIGAVLIFAFIIAALAAAQVVLVPQSNEELEASHNEQAQQSMSDIRGAIQRSAAVGASQSESIDLGVDYPTRLLLLNPGEGAGTIRTEGSDQLTIENAEATDEEVSDFWTGDPVNAPSKQLIYNPSYNYYENAPETVYQNSVLYHRFSDGVDIVQSDQDIVNGRQIYFTALDGDKSTSQSDAASVDVTSVSAATETITVEDDGGPVKVTIPTDLPEEVWVQELLSEEIDDTDDGQAGPEAGDVCDGSGPNVISGADPTNDRFITSCSYDDTVTPHELTLTFQEDNQNGNPVTYNLKMAKVGVGSGITTPDSEYITDLKGDGTDVSLNGRQEIVFQVRNKYNNPGGDAEVDVRLVGGPSGQKLMHEGVDITGQPNDNIPVGPDGKIRLIYVAPGSTSSNPVGVDVEAKFDGSFGSGGAEDADVSMEVINPSRISQTKPLLNNPNTLKVTSAKIKNAKKANECGKTVCAVDVKFESVSGNDVEIDEFRYVFYKPDRQSASAQGNFGQVTVVGASDNPYELTNDFGSMGLTVPNDNDGDSSDSEGVIRFKFQDKNGNPVEVEKGDFFVVSFILDGERQTFFIGPSPEKDTGS